MPSTIPVLSSGSKEVVIIPGIKKNGLVTARVSYPFYKAYSQTRELIPAEVDTIIPTVQYRKGLNFQWLEDFEDGTISLEGTGTNTTEDSMFVTDVPEEVFSYDGEDNKYSGKVILDHGLQIFENSSIDVFDLPRGGQDIFLEINFKCNTEFVVGIYPLNSSVVSGTPIVNLFSTVDAEGDMQWKKAYISLKEDVNTGSNIGADFRVFFNSQTNVSEGTPEISLDNIKLVHF
ncbi:MAG: hypothetical protein ACPGYY_01895 [Bacteroidia bacterium]